MEEVLVQAYLPEEEFRLRVGVKHFVAEMMTEIVDLQLEADSTTDAHHDDRDDILDDIGFLLASDLFAQIRIDSGLSSTCDAVLNLVAQLRMVLDSFEMDLYDLGSSEAELSKLIAQSIKASYLDTVEHWLGFTERYPTNKWGEFTFCREAAINLIKALKALSHIIDDKWTLHRIKEDIKTFQAGLDGVVMIDGPKPATIVIIFTWYEEIIDSFINHAEHNIAPSTTQST